MKRTNLPAKSPCRVLALMLTGTLLASGGTAIASPAESDVLLSLANNGIRPSLTQVATTARKLADASRQMCAQPDAASLKKAQDAWREAFLAQCRATPFMFGPADKLDRQLGKPVNGVVLDAAVSADDLSHLLKNPDVRGYAAAEHLLFVPANVAAATAAERCTHLQAVTSEIADLTGRAKQGWDQDFGQEFIAAGDGKPFLVPGDALSLALAEFLNTTETMLRDGIGFPSGFFEGAAKPELLDGWRSNTSREAFQATLDGLRLALLADETSGLAALVASKDGLISPRNPALAADLREQIEKIQKTIAGLGGSDLVLHAELRNQPKKLKSLYQQLQTLQDQLVEVTLVLELDVRSAVEKQ